MGNALATTCHLTPRQWALLSPDLREADDWIWLPADAGELSDEHIAAIRAMHPLVDNAISDIARSSLTHLNDTPQPEAGHHARRSA